MGNEPPAMTAQHLFGKEQRSPDGACAETPQLDSVPRVRGDQNPHGPLSGGEDVHAATFARPLANHGEGSGAGHLRLSVFTSKGPPFFTSMPPETMPR